MNNDDKSKWACTTCSYANWPLARKCVLCLTPKDTTIDVESGKVKAEIIQPIHEKWTCKKCTFDNWPASQKCTMCQMVKDDTSASVPEADQEGEGACAASAGITRNSRRSRKNKPANSEINKDKWVCPRCTYANHNKNKKCVMCQISPTPGYFRQLSNSSSSSTDSNESRRSGSRIIEKCTRSDRSEARCTKSEGSRRTERSRVKVLYDSDSKKQIRNRILQEDWPWFHACIGAIEGDTGPVETYIKKVGTITRALTGEECKVLTIDTVALEQGQTLAHLALRFTNHHVAVLLFSFQQQARPGATPHGGLKRMPSYECPNTANEIRRLVASNIRQNTIGERFGDFYSHYMCDPVTFVLPCEILTFSSGTQSRLFDEILDIEAQRVLEVDNRIINWDEDIVKKYKSKLYVLWNRSAGDCLLDSALQATWGVNDRDGSLRRALSNSLINAADKLYPRWKEYERMHAANMQYTLNESQWSTTWRKLVKLAEQPGKSLEQAHIFALSHILRRPIIVYGVKYVHNWTGEVLDYARFEGIYLPLLWDNSFCTKSPIVLGYTRGHFSALVGMQRTEGRCELLLPLTDHQHRILPVHFITEREVGLQDDLIREWLETTETTRGVLCAIQRASTVHILSQHLMDEWLVKYRRTTTT